MVRLRVVKFIYRQLTCKDFDDLSVYIFSISEYIRKFGKIWFPPPLLQEYEKFWQLKECQNGDKKVLVT